MISEFFKKGIARCFIIAIIAAGFISTLSSCGGSDSFVINGTVEGLGTRNLRFYYFDGTNLQVGAAAAIDSKFRFEGHSKNRTLLTISTGQRNILGKLIVEDGDEIDLRLVLADPTTMEVKGSKPSAEYAAFLAENSDDIKQFNSAALNDKIARLVETSPDKVSTTALLLSFFDSSADPVLADSLLNMISPKARPSSFIAGYKAFIEREASETVAKEIAPLTFYCEKDSLTTINPAASKRTLFTFSRGSSALLDSIVGVLDTLDSKYKAKDLRIVNVGLDSDTANWMKAVRAARPKGLNVWAPGAVSSPRLQAFPIRSLPSFAVVDSAGTIVYFGTGFTTAVEAARGK